MWHSTHHPVAGGGSQYCFFDEQGPLSFQQVIHLWQTSHDFSAFFCQQLKDAPYPAYFLELPPITEANYQRSFECVLMPSHQLNAISADGRAFEAFFGDAGSVVSFDNLGGDAHLVAPCPMAETCDYAHLAAFSRTADAGQQRDFWQSVGECCQQRLNPQPLWLSTSGLGVYWLHMRLDSHPKYYTYAPYKRFDVTG